MDTKNSNIKNPQSEIPLEVELAEKIAALDWKNAEEEALLREQLVNWKLENEQKFRELEYQLNKATGKTILKQSLPDPSILMRFMYFILVANNRWKISLDGLTAISADGSRKTFFAKVPFSVDIPLGQQCNLLFYFEVLVKKMVERGEIRIGLTSSAAYPTDWHLGTYNSSNYSVGKYNIAVSVDDVVGCGLFLMPIGKNRQIFFTKNGEPYGTPEYLYESFEFKYLYPAVTLEGKGTTVEANFGNNPLKPFRYFIPKHETC